jgi:hypothetical protein
MSIIVKHGEGGEISTADDADDADGKRNGEERD